MPTKARELHILDKTVKGKKVFFIKAYEYLSNPKKEVKYPQLKKQFSKHTEAKEYALNFAKNLERTTSVRIVTRFL